MAVIVRSYDDKQDYERVNGFLRETFNPDGPFLNWEQVRWEYSHYHPLFDPENTAKNGLWEDDGRIVAMVNYEMKLGEAFFQFRPGYEKLFPEMLEYAEETLSKVGENGEHFMKVFVPNWDEPMISLVRAKGYVREGTWSDWYSRFDIPDRFPEFPLPQGYRVQGLDAENNLDKIHVCLWKGFDHGDDVQGEAAGRAGMQAAPNWKAELNIVAVAPDGSFVAYAGLWYDPQLKCCFIEPVATVPKYRRMGLGRAAVMEGVRRCAERGARWAFVGSDQPFYRSMGFKPISARSPWIRSWVD